MEVVERLRDWTDLLAGRIQHEVGELAALQDELPFVTAPLADTSPDLDDHLDTHNRQADSTGSLPPVAEPAEPFVQPPAQNPRTAAGHSPARPKGHARVSIAIIVIAVTAALTTVVALLLGRGN